MKLLIDTTENTKLTLQLDSVEKQIEYDSPRNQDVLIAIEQFLSELGRTTQDLTSIEVVRGPGAFTSLRVGIAVANALSYALKIPINSQPAGTSIEPEYGRPASITMPAKNAK